MQTFFRTASLSSSAALSIEALSIHKALLYFAARNTLQKDGGLYTCFLRAIADVCVIYYYNFSVFQLSYNYNNLSAVKILGEFYTVCYLCNNYSTYFSR